MPVVNDVPAVRVGDLRYLSDTGLDPSMPRCKVGKDVTLEQGHCKQLQNDGIRTSPGLRSFPKNGRSRS